MPRAAAADDATARSPESLGAVGALGLLAVISVSVTLALTSKGAGYGVDSAVYLGMARNLVGGGGPTAPLTFYTDHYAPAAAFAFHGRVPSTHFAPLYPAMLAILESIGLSASRAVRWSGAGLGVVNLALVATILSRVLMRRPWVGAVAGAAVLLTIESWLSTYSFALSEALFVTWVLSGLVVLSRYLATSSPRMLIAIASCASAAVLTRWVGISVALTAGALIMARGGWSLRARLARAAIVVGAGAMAGFGWALYGALAGGSSPRVLAFHPPHRFVNSLLDVLAGWFVRPTPSIGALLALAAILGAGVAMSRHRRMPHASTEIASERAWLLTACAAFGAIYVLVVYEARTFLDASIPTGFARGVLGPFQAPRIYVPLLPVALVLALAAVERTATGLLPVKHALRAGVVVPVVCVVFAAIPPMHLVAPYRKVSRLVTTTLERPSQTVLATSALPGNATIATNFPETVYLGTGRGSLMVPLRRLPVTAEPNRAFQREVAQLATLLQRHHGFLVLFRSAIGSQSAIDQTFAQYSNPVVVARYPDGAIFRVLPRTPAGRPSS